MKETISHERLLAVLDYNPATGIFTNRINRRKAKAGAIAGGICHGYRLIGIDGRSYRAHRLAVFYMLGRWPESEVDHRNNKRADNRWENLREATSSTNKANTPARPSKSGLRGVHRTPKGKSTSKIQVNKKQIHLGTFKDDQTAFTAYCKAAQTHFGEFARPN